MRPRLPTWLLVAVLASACSPATNAPTTTSTVVATTSTTTGATASTTATTLPAGTEELPESLRAEIARLIPRTAELRELEFETMPTITVLSTEELSQRVIEQVEEEYEDVAVDQALYELLGLTGPDFDLLETLKSLYGEQVAGYYDGDEKELVVTARNDVFSPLEEATLVHELTHALTDQVHAFNDRFNDLFDNDRFDEGSAFQAVVEGDATLVETLFVQQLSPDEQQEFLEEAFAIDSSVFDSVPGFIQDSLLFPYREGATFTQAVWSDGGFAAIDALYAQPPSSTEQIIHPEDYPGDVPLAVEVAGQELTGYEHAYGSTWGELGFRLMFDQILGGANAAADGWGGDDYDVYFNGSEAVLILLYEGENPADAQELAGALRDYYQIVTGIAEPEVDGGPGAGMVFQGEDYAFVANVGSRVLWVTAGDAAAGAIARGWYPEF